MACVDYTYVISALLTEKEWFSSCEKKEKGDGISREIVVGINRHDDDDAVISISIHFSHSFFVP